MLDRIQNIVKHKDQDNWKRNFMNINIDFLLPYKNVGQDPKLFLNQFLSNDNRNYVKTHSTIADDWEIVIWSQRFFGTLQKCWTGSKTIF